MTEMVETTSESVLPVPAGFGTGRAWRVRAQEYELPNHPNLSGTLMVKRGMLPPDWLVPLYWQVHGGVDNALKAHDAAGVPRPNHFLLFDFNKNPVGISALDPDDGPDEIAHLACLFFEIGMRLVLPLHDTVPTEGGFGAGTLVRKLSGAEAA